ncbi:hypothetical protein SAMN05421780_11334 [Flexibacter flexilis DSM 6793]|uniref:Uncharacterized protein n=1 Tax=Flexibacter flexilis DSM 6793 TaxID=927664 RepID=A0A1I1N801_9BACT|nr:hypothetical protein [Flexibacter flexilis]SFC93749.1 hypothetical protein SAMN05421780_11334 [Flexibacter flexilis DSM 6793]
MSKAFEMPTGDMLDLKKVIIWHTLSDNKDMFNKNYTSNVWTMYNTVADLMKTNGDSIAPNKSVDALTNSILDMIP